MSAKPQWKQRFLKLLGETPAGRSSHKIFRHAAEGSDGPKPSDTTFLICIQEGPDQIVALEQLGRGRGSLKVILGQPRPQGVSDLHGKVVYRGERVQPDKEVIIIEKLEQRVRPHT